MNFHDDPIFPVFSNIDLSHQKSFQNFLKDYPPYSDFNFVSIFSYDDKSEIQFSYLNHSLVLKFQDYLNREVFFTFLGKSSFDETAQTLLKEAEKQGFRRELQMLPANVGVNLSHDLFLVEEDVDNNDYVLGVSELINFSGAKFSPKRNFVNRFNRLYGDKVQVRQININEIEVKKSIMNLFDIWESHSEKEHDDTLREKAAIAKLLDNADSFELISVGIYYEDKLIGFSIQEIVGGRYAMLHFEKADINFVGVFPYLKSKVAKVLQENHIDYINYEQDLGLEGLRKAKLAYHPAFFLKKYKARMKFLS